MRANASAMLRLPRFQLATPASLEDAARLLRDHGAAEQDPATVGTPGLGVMLVSGGTDLYPNMKRRQFTPAVVISLRRALGREIRNGDGLRIGAGATLAAIVASDRVRGGYVALAEAALSVSTPQLRNMGTIGGNLCLDTRCN